MLIATGSNRNSAAGNNQIGAGVPALPTNSTISWGKVSVTNGQVVEVTIPNGTMVDAAIWWPETMSTHNDVDLKLMGASGYVLSGSYSVNGIWEKVSVQGGSDPAASLRISGYSVTGTQTVYWASIRR
jgi:hypothetical protein